MQKHLHLFAQQVTPYQAALGYIRMVEVSALFATGGAGKSGVTQKHFGGGAVAALLHQSVDAADARQLLLGFLFFGFCHILGIGFKIVLIAAVIADMNEACCQLARGKRFVQAFDAQRKRVGMRSFKVAGKLVQR